MTYYCSADHAKNDVEHRKLCTALQQVAAEETGKSASVQTVNRHLHIDTQN